MCPTIRVDGEVYAWLQGQGVAFEDTPNSVLRRLAGLDEKAPDSQSTQADVSTSKGKATRQPARRRSPLATGEELIAKWNIPALQARFHRDGIFYEKLAHFPAALCDRNGYVVFETEMDYANCPHLHIAEKVNVPTGIWSIEGYTRVKNPV